MLFGQDRTQLRQVFFTAWRKYRAGEPMEPMERLIAEIVAHHPEYHASVENPEAHQDRDYLPETGESNPFLHLAMHIAIQEQLGTDRPAGFRAVYRTLVARASDPHAAEHRIMDCLGETLWRAQREGAPPDEAAYMDCLRRLAQGR
jgi:hypothetical protein